MRYPKGYVKGNEIVNQSNGITEMKYSNCDKTFIVDTNQLPVVQQYTWHKGTSGYAMAPGNKVYDKRTLVKLHRVLLEDELNKPENEGMVVDHIDRNKDNNILVNLRIVPPRINELNSQQSIDAKIQINGVREDNGKYVTRAVLNGKRYNLGSYNDMYDAGLVYDSFIYNKRPEREWDAMNIRQGKIPEDVLEKYGVDPNDPSTLPRIPCSKQGENTYNGVFIDKKYGYCSVYIKNIDRKQEFIIKGRKGISEVEGAAIREQYLLEHPELADINIPNAVWPEETDGKINVASEIVDRNTYELATRGY